ncbi:MAG: hypothetical protein ACREAU_03155 [Nitrosopumilaceae archaeon]
MEEETPINKKYIYGYGEVILTGRTAVRPRDEDRPQRANRTKTSTSDALYEIIPANPIDGTWKKWVKITDLYEIKDNNKGE